MSAPIEWLPSPLLEAVPGVVARFSLRRGGQSQGPYAGANFSTEVGDRLEDVSENRGEVLRQLGMRRLAVPQLEHGREVWWIEHPGQAPQTADAVLASRPGIAAAVTVADCVPILLLDPDKRVVAAVHSGWRSTALDVLGQAIRAMGQRWGCRPEDLLASVGPHISAANYPVGPEVRERFLEALGPSFADCFLPWEDRWKLDLREAIDRQLRGHGLPEGQVEHLRHCTYAQPDRFFSARRDGARSGRGFAVVGLAE